MSKSAITIIKAFGGTEAAAALTGSKPNAVRMWPTNGIPYRYWPLLIAEAETRGIDGVSLESLMATRRSKPSSVSEAAA